MWNLYLNNGDSNIEIFATSVLPDVRSEDIAVFMEKVKKEISDDVNLIIFDGLPTVVNNEHLESLIDEYPNIDFVIIS